MARPPTAKNAAATAGEETAGNPAAQHADELQNGGPGYQEAGPNANRNLRGGAAAAATTPFQGPGTAVPVTRVHEQEWFEPGEETIKLKSVCRRQWKITIMHSQHNY